MMHRHGSGRTREPWSRIANEFSGIQAALSMLGVEWRQRAPDDHSGRAPGRTQARRNPRGGCVVESARLVRRFAKFLGLIRQHRHLCLHELGVEPHHFFDGLRARELLGELKRGRDVLFGALLGEESRTKLGHGEGAAERFGRRSQVRLSQLRLLLFHRCARYWQ